MKKDLNVKFSTQRVFFDSAYCALISYCIAMLLSRGYKASEAGIIMFLSQVISFFMQPVVASFCDKSKKNIINRTLVIEDIFVACAVFISCFLIKNKIVFGVLYMLGIAVLDMNNSLLNSVQVYYRSRGWKINYELSRAAGALGFSLLSLLYGQLMSKVGANAVMGVGIGLCLSVCIVSLTFPKDDSEVKVEQDGDVSSFGEFVKNHKWFFVSMFGIMVIALVHVMVENYLIEEVSRIGGDSSSVGIALFIATGIEAPMMLVYGKIHDKLGTYKSFIIVGLSYILKVILFLSAKSLIVIYIAQLLQATSYTFLAPAMLYYARECTSSSDMVKGQSIVLSSFSLGGSLGCLLGGIIISALGVLSMLKIGLVLALIGTVVLVFTVPKAYK